MKTAVKFKRVLGMPVPARSPQMILEAQARR